MDVKTIGRESILVIDEVEETRDAVEKLLTADGYRVCTSRDEQTAIASSGRRKPELILMSRGKLFNDVVAAARRIRKRVRPGDTVPIVIFSVETLAEGAEMDIGENTHLVHPDNFDQLRRLVRRLLHHVAYLP